MVGVAGGCGGGGMAAMAPEGSLGNNDIIMMSGSLKKNPCGLTEHAGRL